MLEAIHAAEKKLRWRNIIKQKVTRDHDPPSHLRKPQSAKESRKELIKNTDLLELS